jgi:hypothetical protein
MSNTTKPVARVSIYPVSAAIWKNQSGKGEPFFSVTFQRSYKDDAGEYKNTDGFNASDLLILAKVADLAHTQVLRLRAADRAAKGVADALDDSLPA